MMKRRREDSSVCVIFILPKELRLEILYHLGEGQRDLLSFCLTCKEFYALLMTKDLWLTKAIRDGLVRNARDFFFVSDTIPWGEEKQTSALPPDHLRYALKRRDPLCRYTFGSECFFSLNDCLRNASRRLSQTWKTSSTPDQSHDYRLFNYFLSQAGLSFDWKRGENLFHASDPKSPILWDIFEGVGSGTSRELMLLIMLDPFFARPSPSEEDDKIVYLNHRALLTMKKRDLPFITAYRSLDPRYRNALTCGMISAGHYDLLRLIDRSSLNLELSEDIDLFEGDLIIRRACMSAGRARNFSSIQWFAQEDGTLYAESAYFHFAVGAVESGDITLFCRALNQDVGAWRADPPCDYGFYDGHLPPKFILLCILSPGQRLSSQLIQLRLVAVHIVVKKYGFACLLNAVALLSHSFDSVRDREDAYSLLYQVLVFYQSNPLLIPSLLQVLNTTGFDDEEDVFFDHPTPPPLPEKDSPPSVFQTPLASWSPKGLYLLLQFLHFPSEPSFIFPLGDGLVRLYLALTDVTDSAVEDNLKILIQSCGYTTLTFLSTHLTSSPEHMAFQAWLLTLKGQVHAASGRPFVFSN